MNIDLEMFMVIGELQGRVTERQKFLILGIIRKETVLLKWKKIKDQIIKWITNSRNDICYHCNSDNYNIVLEWILVHSSLIVLLLPQI